MKDESSGTEVHFIIDPRFKLTAERHHSQCCGAYIRQSLAGGRVVRVKRSIVIRLLQTMEELRRDGRKRNILGRSARRRPAPSHGQTALRRFRLAKNAKLLQIWVGRRGYLVNTSSTVET